MNYFAVGYNAFEFILDFGQYDTQDETARMHTRVVTGPAFAKLLAEMLGRSVERFESEHGSIRPTHDEAHPDEIRYVPATGDGSIRSP
jgi:hypothetical protein